MKIKNINIVGIYRCVQEIIDSKDAKKELQDSGKVVYASVKNLNMLKPIVDALAKSENDLRMAANEAGSSKETPNAEIQKQFVIDIDKLYETEQDVELHKISLAHCEILQKHLTGASTHALFSYIILE